MNTKYAAFRAEKKHTPSLCSTRIAFPDRYTASTALPTTPFATLRPNDSAYTPHEPRQLEANQAFQKRCFSPGSGCPNIRHGSDERRSATGKSKSYEDSPHDDC